MPAKRIYIDCTDTYTLGRKTGIQRVVRNIVNRCKSIELPSGYECVPVVAFLDEFYPLDHSRKCNFRTTRAVIGLMEWLRNQLDRLLLTSPHNNSENVELAGSVESGDEKPNIAHGRVLRLCRKIAPIITQMPAFFDKLLSRSKKISPNASDVIFLADSFWNSSTYGAFQKIRNSGLKTIVLVYDIIPITHGYLVQGANRDNFINCFFELMETANGVVSISEYSIKEIEKSCNEHVKNKLSYNYFHLGADFAKKELAVIDDKHPLRSRLDNKLFFTMVGTIEPRKNHIFVIDAFEKLWERGYTFSLCIVGRIGWMCDDILERIYNSKYYDHFLFYFKDINDNELTWCMSKSHAVIMASIVEGFGLPIIEAMDAGKALLASDIPAFREVGGDYPFYFSLDDQETLINRIVQVSNDDFQGPTCIHRWLTWDESVRDLMEKVVKMVEAPHNGQCEASQPYANVT